MKRVGMLVSGIIVLSMAVTAWGQSTFTTTLYDDEARTEMELVTLDGDTYFETKLGGVFQGSTKDMVVLLTPVLIKEAVGRKPGKVDGVAATVKGHRISGFIATAGQKGMHVHVDLGGGVMNFGKGMLYDVLKLHREVVFDEGEIGIPRMEKDKEVGSDVYTCAKGARICASDQDGKLCIIGVSHKYVAKDDGR